MLKIRLLRVGRKHDPSFRVVVVDSAKSPASGDYLEKVGFFNPRKNETKLEGERINHWISRGAQPSDTVHNLLVSQRIIKGRKIDVSGRKKPSKEKPAEEKPRS